MSQCHGEGEGKGIRPLMATRGLNPDPDPDPNPYP